MSCAQVYSGYVVMSLRRLSQAAQEAVALLARRWSSSSASCSSCTALKRQVASATPFRLATPGVALRQVTMLVLKTGLRGNVSCQ